MTVGLQSSPSASWESRECLEDESIEKIRSNLEGAPPVVVAALAIAAIEAVVRDLAVARAVASRSVFVSSVVHRYYWRLKMSRANYRSLRAFCHTSSGLGIATQPSTPATPERRGRWTMRCIAMKRPSIASLPQPLTSDRRSLSTLKSRLLPRK